MTKQSNSNKFIFILKKSIKLIDPNELFFFSVGSVPSLRRMIKSMIYISKL